MTQLSAQYSRSEEQLLIGLAIFGLLLPNGIFLYYAILAPDVLRDAIANPVAMMFMLEAFLLMGFGSWLIHRRKMREPGWIAFIIMSLVGSLAFSVPAFLYLSGRSRGARKPRRK